jgi:transposase
MARPPGSAELLEERRRQALALVQAGLSFRDAGRRMNCAPSSVMRWFHAWQRGGIEALRPDPHPGRPRKLDLEQRRLLVGLLLQGPVAHGYSTNRWTTVRIAEVIERQFGVHYHFDHIGRLMRSLAWTRQAEDPGWAPTTSIPVTEDSSAYGGSK